MKNKKNIFSKGFTLIELLVVISVIGILAGIILVSVNSVRNKAKDALVKSEMNQLKTAAEMFYNEHDTYIGVENDPQVASIRSDILSKAGSTVTFRVNPTGGSEYVAYAQLVSSTKYWAVDSTGQAVQLTNLPNASVYRAIEGSGGGGTTTETNCADGVDNDSDQSTDCDDSDCSSSPSCISTACNSNTTCDSGEDCSNCSADCGCSSGYSCNYNGTTYECQLSATCGNTNCETGETCNSCPSDCGVCCGNSSCESSYGEDCNSCSGDCGACCGNSSCESIYAEDCNNCSADCGCSSGYTCTWLSSYYGCQQDTYCGNTNCDSGEDCSNCSADCGCSPGYSCNYNGSNYSCQQDVTCGNGNCQYGEDCNNCSTDCGCGSGYYCNYNGSSYSCQQNNCNSINCDSSNGQMCCQWSSGDQCCSSGQACDWTNGCYYP